MRTTRKLMAAACTGALLLACGTPPASRIPDGAGTAFLGADAYYTLGRVEHGAGRLVQARQAWQLALQVDPRHRAARNGLAVLRAGQGDYAGAIALWRTLVAESADAAPGERAFLLGNLGYALYLQGGYDEAVTLLEQACVLDPLQPQTWEQLAAVLAAAGDTARALRMTKQARTLRTHDIRRDYGLAGATASMPPGAGTAEGVAGSVAGSVAESARDVTPWPAGMARTELRQAGAVVEVHRIAAPEALAAPPSSGPRPVATTPALHLEISNGNGVRGMAAAWARRLQDQAWQSVRITNARPYTVPVTRIEYRGTADIASVARALAGRLGLATPLPMAGSTTTADLRIVLGRDQRARVARAAVHVPAGGRAVP
ncbi:TPR repeat protein [Pseudoduganella lurida]|uniref:TPR repeat protein n=1 Tax=Pseudoduganella lurida TaxID=1036180 RepID=A0A562R1Z0_9BURK|nr:LytR C-terminal domain-containing protein [Pseudoduganella lurida]TWI63057.1 TPR repeat protein [Pseudoduganella lurida]